ncbi:MAG: heavy metal translocating P-type ATPase [Bacillota bacterium]
MRCHIQGLDCPICARKIEEALQKTEGLQNARINFATSTLTVREDKVDDAAEVMRRIEPGVRLTSAGAYDHSHASNASERGGLPKRDLVRVAVAVTAFALGWLPHLSPSLPDTLASVLFLIAFAAAGYPVILAAFRSLGQKALLDENVLMTIATAGALALGEFAEAAAVMVFFSVGETLQGAAVRRSRAAVTSLMELRPEMARLADGDGELVPVEGIAPGEVIIVHPGERVPLDGMIIDGETSLDTSALTGESAPRAAAVGDEIHAGSVNGSGVVTVEVTRPHDRSAVARILDLVTEAAEHRAPVEKFLTRFARWYTPMVVLAALSLAILPPLFVPGQTFADWSYRALVLLVISCPCALVVSIPLGYFAGIGLASRNGILIKGADVLDTLVSVKTILFDKTGTLTDGRMQVESIEAEPGFSEGEILRWAARAEARSSHPIADAINRRANLDNTTKGAGFEEIAGRGMIMDSPEATVAVGNARLMEGEGIEVKPTEETQVFVALDGNLAGRIILVENYRAGIRETLKSLREAGIQNMVLLTGDNDAPARRLAHELGIENYHSELLPEDKVDHLLRVQDETDHPLMYVGDGINDAPVLAAADVGAALGGLGSDAAIEAADLVIMEDRLDRIGVGLDVAKRTRQKVIQNTAGALGLKGAFLILGAVGLAGIWAAVFADVGVALLAVINSASLLRARVGN